MFKKILLASVAAGSMVAASSAAHAGGFALREQSAGAMGGAFAGAAAGAGGLSAMFWNPATLTNNPGIQTSATLTGVLPYSNITPDASRSATLVAITQTSAATGDIAQDALLPAGYASWQVMDKLWVGLSINTPFGLVTQNPNLSTGRFYGLTSKVASIDVAPTIAYRVNDWLSVGAGARVMNFKVRLTGAAQVGLAILQGDDTAYGFTGGVTLKPWKGGEIGLGYRSGVSPKLSGTITTAAGVTDITSNMKLPEQVSVGLRQQLTNDFTFLAGYEWTHWGAFTRFPVLTTSGATATTLYFDYRDSWYASLGGEYKWNKDLTLRAGLGFEKSPITDAIRSVRLPDSDRTWATLGASYSVNNKLSLDASYAHLFAKAGSINIVPGNPSYLANLPLVASTKGHVDIISLSLTYRWDDPSPKASNKALVTK